MRWPAAGALLLLSSAGLAAEPRLDIARFSAGDMHDWQSEQFKGTTHYSLVSDENRLVLRADSDNSASGMVRRITVDLHKTPYLHWSWKVNKLLSDNDERTRAGDDYPVRVYVVFSGGLFFWRTRAINYVWSSHQPLGTSWPNAFTAQARMLAVDTGESSLNRWVSHRRDIRADYRQLFGSDVTHVDAVAIMSDTDNTGQQATGWYGDIWFSAE